MSSPAAWAWPALIVLAMLHWGTAAAQRAPDAEAVAAANAAIVACGSRLDGAPTGLAELEGRCPELAAALQTAQIGPLIIGSSRDRLDRQSLRQLQRLLHRTTGPAPAVSALTPFLQHPHSTLASRSWWQRLWDWLLERLMPKNLQNPNYSWLEQIARALGRARWLWAAIIWGAILALPIFVVVIIVREVRAMGRRSIDDPVTAAALVAPGVRDPSLAQLRRTPLGQRPAQLFAMLISRLVAAGRLPPDRSLTHREIVRRVLLDDADQRRFLASLARASERQLYAGAAAAPADIEQLLAQGEDLYTTGWGRPVAR
jgi:hypothetical protein